MKKLLLVSLCFLVFCITQASAQNLTVTGTITAKDDGLPIPGVTVKVKGTTMGTQTNTAGKYTISVPKGAVLIFTFIGYETTQVPVTGPTLSLALNVLANQIGEVQVTTSLGIKHAEKELGYAVTSVSAASLTETNVTNLANGLTAKVAGLGVFSLDNGIDPNVAVQLRGNRSLLGNNNALIVLDGVPIPGSDISSINPNDVADVTVLKGAGAAAIYGSEASNGALLITTKRGTTDGKPIITYENSFQFQNIAYYPKLQNQFGEYGGEPNYVDPLTGFTENVPYENQLYGPKFNGSTVLLGAPLDSLTGKQLTQVYSPYKENPIKAFFNTGYTEQNDISISQGDSKNSFFMSAQNVYTTGIVPNDQNIKYAFSIRGHRTFGSFYTDYSVGYTKTSVSTYGYGYNGANLFTTVLQLPADLNIKAFSDPNGANSIGNPSNFYDSYAINPYWIVDDARNNYTKDVFLTKLKVGLTPTNWLDISYQASDNFGLYQDRYTSQEVDFTPYAVSDPLHSGNVPSAYTSGKVPGQVYDSYQYGDGSGSGYGRIQGDLVAALHKTFFKDLRTSLVLGNSIYQESEKAQSTGSSNLLLANFYNINTISGFASASEGTAMIRQIAYFADLNLNYKGYLNLEGTYRNEQDSRLSKAERSFNYPSGKLSFIPTDLISALKNNPILNYAKFYGSVSQVGNIDIGPYEINNVYGVGSGFPYGALGGLVPGSTNYSPTLKPELTTEVEVGTELSFFQSRLDVNFSYYVQHVKNQTVPINTSITTGYFSSVVNIGETESKGQEIQVTGQILTQAKNKVGVTLGANFSANQSDVISLLPGGAPSFSLGNYQYAVIGKPFPLLEGSDFVRDPQGHVVVSPTTGYPYQSQNQTTFGRTTPAYILGTNLNVNYKFISLSAVAEYRGGDVVFNQIGQTFTFAGSSQLTAEAGRERFIYPNSVIQTGPNTYVPNTSTVVQNGQYGFWQGSVFSSTMSPYVTSGAFWKLREVNLAFKLDKFIKGFKTVKGATFALTGRNLYMWLPKTNIWSDPEFANVSTTSNLRGVSTDNITPGTRLFGASLKVTF